MDTGEWWSLCFDVWLTRALVLRWKIASNWLLGHLKKRKKSFIWGLNQWPSGVSASQAVDYCTRCVRNSRILFRDLSAIVDPLPFFWKSVIRSSFHGRKLSSAVVRFTDSALGSRTTYDLWIKSNCELKIRKLLVLWTWSVTKLNSEIQNQVRFFLVFFSFFLSFFQFFLFIYYYFFEFFWVFWVKSTQTKTKL